MDRISIKITFITREFVNTEFMKSLLAQLNLREILHGAIFVPKDSHHCFQKMPMKKRNGF